MKSNITINIVEPGSTLMEPVVPNTGLFAHGIGGPEATILGITAAVIILAVVLAVLYCRKKQGKSISLKHKKATTIGLASLAAVVSLGTVAGLLKLGANATDDSLTVTTSSEELTIELADEPVFAVLPVELTVAEATEAGYTLTAYAEDTNLVSTTNPSDIIPMVTAEDKLVALADNTYGLALVEPEDKADEVYAPLSTDVDNPTLITDKDYKATEAEDITTIYYGFYITPDVPKGTYTGSSINYEAQPNYITNLSFDGNGSDGGEAIEDITILAGDAITLPPNTFTREGYSFTGWNTEVNGEGKAYADEAEFTASLTESEDITLYAQWEEDVLYMQNVSSWGNTLVEDVIVEAIDSRDGKTYKVAKLKDGKIWMVQNLDLQAENLKQGVVLDSTNTDNPANGFTLPTSQVSGNDSWGDSSIQADVDVTHVYDIAASGIEYRYCLRRTHRCVEEGDVIPAAELGNLYNWYTATAGTGTYSTGSTLEGSFEATGSICPAGWRLPNNSNNSEATDYSTLLYLYGITESPTSSSYISIDGTAIYNAPLSFVPSGSYEGALNDVGLNGYLWSSLADSSSNTRSRYLTFYADYVNPWSGYYKISGNAVRCVAQ